MPRIDDRYLECVIYLYPDVPSAQSGGAFGGSGFLVMVPSEVNPEKGYHYAVTNSHVIREGNSPVIRLNTKEGDLAIVNLGQDDWTHHPEGDDIAVAGIEIFDLVKYKYVHVKNFITQEIIEQHDIGPGDDIFMVGRLVNHEGRQRNIPSARFGNISIMPIEPLLSGRGIQQDSFVAEMRSIPGYSGSPAFVQIPPMSQRPGSKALRSSGFGPWLLGIDWCHLPIIQKVLENDHNSPVREGWVVSSSTGMAGIIPAWKIKECIDVPALVEGRIAGDKRLEAENQG